MVIRGYLGKVSQVWGLHIRTWGEKSSVLVQFPALPALVPIEVYWKTPSVILATCALAASIVGSSAASGLSDRSNSTDAVWDANSCVQCHIQTRGLNHPVGVMAAEKTDLPLSNGRIDCLTCHTDKATSVTHTGGFVQGQANLLRKSPRVLCNSCHGSDLLSKNDASSKSHGVAMAKAHLEEPANKISLSAGRFDSETRECLSCHDGSSASHSGVREPNSGIKSGTLMSIKSMHPIGVEYSWMPKGRMAPQYKPVSSLPSSVRLFDGKVGCGSCHSIYSGEEQMMSVDPKRGRLCLSCHIK